MDENKQKDKSFGDDDRALPPSLFGDSQYFEFLYKKTEKLSSALYMVTSFIKDTDPIKPKIRSHILSALSLSLSLGTLPVSQKKSSLSQYQSILVEVLSLATVAFHAKLVSEMNHLIIKKELENIITGIVGERGMETENGSISLNPSFFDTGHGLAPSSESASTATSGKGAGKGQKFLASRFSESTLKDKKINSGRKEAPGEKSGRRDVILNLLNKRQGLGIKDFVGFIPNCSEKTIQRELVSMLEAGVIRKEGERRWSKYYLNN